MSSQKKDKKENFVEIMNKIEFMQTSIGELQNKIKDVIIYLENASTVEGFELPIKSGLDDADTKREK